MVSSNKFFAQHTHGAGGVDALLFNEGDDERLAQAYKEIDIAAATPTLLTADKETLWRAQERYLSSKHKGGLFYGLFSEGNFGAPSKKGCQNAALMEPLTLEALERLFAPALEAGFPLRVMFAPETVADLEGTMESILSRYQNVSLVVGHSDATAEKAIEALRCGAKGFVHFGNAMSGSVAQRNPIDADQVKALSQKHDSELGIKDILFKYNGEQLEYLTGRQGTYFEAIIDGIHVHPEFFLYMIKQFGAENVVPVTDQMAGTGREARYTFDISGKAAIVAEPGGKNPYNGLPGQNVLLAVLKDDGVTLAGSVATDRQLAANAMYWITGGCQKRNDIGLMPVGDGDPVKTVMTLFTNSARIHRYDVAKLLL